MGTTAAQVASRLWTVWGVVEACPEVSGFLTGITMILSSSLFSVSQSCVKWERKYVKWPGLVIQSVTAKGELTLPDPQSSSLHLDDLCLVTHRDYPVCILRVCAVAD